MPENVDFHPEAAKELKHAASWYNEQVHGLGLDFLLEVKSAELRILQHPEAWPEYEVGTRRYIMHTFPFAIVYRTSKEAL